MGGLAAQPGYNVQLTSSRAGWTTTALHPGLRFGQSAAQGPTLTGAQNQIDTCNAPAGVNANFYDTRSGQPRRAGRCPIRVGQAAVHWEFAVAAQHELNQGLSVTAGVFWRWFGNFLSPTTLRDRGDYAQFSVTPGLIPAPPASAGGESLPSNINTGGFFAINPA